MMPDIDAMLLAVSGSLAASVVVKATVIVALGLAGAGLARGSRAAVRHAVLAVAFAALAALPMVMLGARPVRIALQMEAATPVAVAPAAAAVSVAPVIEAPVEATTEPAPSRLSLADWLMAAWTAGAAVFLLPMMVGLWQVRRLRRTGLPWRHGQELAEELAAETGVRRRVEVLLHEELAGPMMCGTRRPVVVLPVDARNWEDEELKRALVHEMEHARRGDWASYCFARAVCAAYWFHPLVWMARRRLVLEAERACDDAVLARCEATAYADQLVGVAERLVAVSRPPVLAMASRADLAKRVGAVLDGGQRRGRAGALLVAMACAGAAAVVMAVAPLQVVAATEAAVTNVTASAPVVAPAPISVAVAPQTPVAKTHTKPALVLLAAGPQAAAPSPPESTAPSQAAGEPIARFSATARLVIVEVAATYQSGGNIRGLTASDFEIAEDSVPRRVLYLGEGGTISGGSGTAAGGSGGWVASGQSHYYVLGYYTPNQELDGKFRKINVTLKDNTSAKLVFRDGYYAGGSRAAVFSFAPPGVTLPQVLRRVEPEYSEAARNAKFQGTVVLRFTVNTDGTAANIHVQRSLGLGQDEKAIEAVKQWRFTPGTKDLVAVPMQAEVVVDFRLF